MKDFFKSMTLAERIAWAVLIVVFGGMMLGILIASGNWDAIAAVTLPVAALICIIVFRPIMKILALARFIGRVFARA